MHVHERDRAKRWRPTARGVGSRCRQQVVRPSAMHSHSQVWGHAADSKWSALRPCTHTHRCGVTLQTTSGAPFGHALTLTGVGSRCRQQVVRPSAMHSHSQVWGHAADSKWCALRPCTHTHRCGVTLQTASGAPFGHALTLTGVGSRCRQQVVRPSAMHSHSQVWGHAADSKWCALRPCTHTHRCGVTLQTTSGAPFGHALTLTGVGSRCRQQVVRPSAMHSHSQVWGHAADSKWCALRPCTHTHAFPLVLKITWFL